MQTPGGPAEDTSNGFLHGGWARTSGDAIYSEIVRQELNEPADYLLGRTTFEIWENYWPHHADFWPGINTGKKYVYSNTRNKSEWKHTNFIKTAHELIQLKESTGPAIHIWGSSQLVQLLLEQNLVDEFRLKIHPVILGTGKQLFGTGAQLTSFTLHNQVTTSTGVLIAHYKRS
jgi:dihydrofolate reductase